METMTELKILCADCSRELEGSETLTCPGCRRAWQAAEGVADAGVSA